MSPSIDSTGWAEIEIALTELLHWRAALDTEAQHTRLRGDSDAAQGRLIQFLDESMSHIQELLESEQFDELYGLLQHFRTGLMLVKSSREAAAFALGGFQYQQDIATARSKYAGVFAALQRVSPRVIGHESVLNRSAWPTTDTIQALVHEFRVMQVQQIAKSTIEVSILIDSGPVVWAEERPGLSDASRNRLRNFLIGYTEAQERLRYAVRLDVGFTLTQIRKLKDDAKDPEVLGVNPSSGLVALYDASGVETVLQQVQTCLDAVLRGRRRISPYVTVVDPELVQAQLQWVEGEVAPLHEWVSKWSSGDDVNSANGANSTISVKQPRVPNRPKDRQRWKETWRVTQPMFRQAKPCTEIETWLQKHHPHLVKSPEVLAEIGRAGAAGMLG